MFERYIVIFENGNFKVVNAGDILKELLVADRDTVTGLIGVGLETTGSFEDRESSLKMKVEIDTGWDKGKSHNSPDE